MLNELTRAGFIITDSKIREDAPCLHAIQKNPYPHLQWSLQQTSDRDGDTPPSYMLWSRDRDGVFVTRAASWRFPDELTTPCSLYQMELNHPSPRAKNGALHRNADQEREKVFIEYLLPELKEQIRQFVAEKQPYAIVYRVYLDSSYVPIGGCVLIEKQSDDDYDFFVCSPECAVHIVDMYPTVKNPTRRRKYIRIDL